MQSRNNREGGRRVAARIVAAIGCLAALQAEASFKDDVGYTQLKAELGGATPTGAGVVVTQVEFGVEVSGQTTWLPDPAHSDLAGKAIVNGSSPTPTVYSSHATNVARRFFGITNSISGGVTDVTVFSAEPWLAGDFLNGGVIVNGRIVRPYSSTSRIANHAWVGDASSGNSEVLRRLDWVIENDDMLQVVAMNNGSGASSFALLGSAFNVIAVGRSDAGHTIGSVAVDSTYATGRTRPDVVFPAGATSYATPYTASALAMLVELGHGNAALSTDPAGASYTNRAGLLVRNAERAEVLKAVLMAGADRVTRNTSSIDLALYRGGSANQSTNGLDRRFGAGQLNIRNSHLIIAAAEQNSSEDGGAGSGSAERGFDYDPAFGGGSGSNSTATYPLPVSATPRLLTATLAWHLDINGGTPDDFDSTATFRDLALTLLDVANPSSPVTVVSSQSTNENTENLYLVVPANAQYALRVGRGSGSSFRYDYGLAWQLLPDADGDGAHDAQDNCIGAANAPLAPDAGGLGQLDADGDGYGNACDGDLDNNGFVNFADLGIFRAAFGTSDAVADLDGNGFVNFADLGIFRSLFGKAPGPSAFSP